MVQEITNNSQGKKHLLILSTPCSSFKKIFNDIDNEYYNEFEENAKIYSLL